MTLHNTRAQGSGPCLGFPITSEHFLWPQQRPAGMGCRGEQLQLNHCKLKIRQNDPESGSRVRISGSFPSIPLEAGERNGPTLAEPSFRSPAPRAQHCGAHTW